MERRHCQATCFEGHSETLLRMSGSLGLGTLTAVFDGCRGKPGSEMRSWNPSSSMTCFHLLPATTARAIRVRKEKIISMLMSKGWW